MTLLSISGGELTSPGTISVLVPIDVDTVSVDRCDSAFLSGADETFDVLLVRLVTLSRCSVFFLTFLGRWFDAGLFDFGVVFAGTVVGGAGGPCPLDAIGTAVELGRD